MLHGPRTWPAFSRETEKHLEHPTWDGIERLVSMVTK